VKDPIFAKTRYRYDSYTDFWKLVELSGYRTCYVDEIDLAQDEVYIVSPVNGEFRPHVQHRRKILTGPQLAKIIWWNLERPDSAAALRLPLDGKVRADNDEILAYADHVWVSDRWMAELDPRSTYVLLGSHEGLYDGSAVVGMPYDVAHLGYVNPRRQAILQGLASLKVSPNGWSLERDAILRGSRMMLNIHQTPAPILEPLRVALAAAYKLPYVTEFTKDAYPLVPDETCLMAPYASLVSLVYHAMEFDIRKIGTALHKRLVIDDNFRTGVSDTMTRTFA
jgi:hypothetical protein